jgi:tRNA nucleotidyltransferase/poly(A) polymerase
VNPGDIEGIDADTRQAIAKRVDNGLKSDNGVEVAPERIRDEFLKGISSAVSVPGYLRLYNQLGLLRKYVFSKLSLSHDYVDSKNPILVIAHLLRNNDVEIIRRRLNSLNYTNREIDDIVYLVNLLHLQPGHLDKKLASQPSFLYNLRKSQRDIHPHDLETWAQLHNLSPEAISQLRGHELKNRDDIPGALGLQGKEIGQHIAKHNTDEMLRKMRFKEWINTYI